MLNILALLTIEIGIDPEIREFLGLTLTWHGVFTAVGIAAGVFTAVVIGRRLGFIEDDIYSVALIAIPCGIVGARALFVIERWDDFSNDLLSVFRVNEGGISVYGAVLGGLVGGLVYCWIRKLPIRRALDGTAPALILGMAIGRIGDIINGEHFSELSGLPWAVRYTHLDSPSVSVHPIESCRLLSVGQELCAQHPAVAYEMIGDLVILGVLIFLWRRQPKTGVIFASAFLLYSVMRFFVSFLRIDSKEPLLGLTTPELTAVIVGPLAALVLLFFLLRREPEYDPEQPTAARSKTQLSRAERRRRLRTGS